MHHIMRKMMIVAALLSNVVSLSNTSPVIVISESKAIEVPRNELNPVTSMNYVFDSIVSNAVQNCGYDTYIFVKHDGISERQINRNTMPFLTHALDVAEGKYFTGLALDGGDSQVNDTITNLLRSIETRCSAINLRLDPFEESQALNSFIDTRPRLISVEFPDTTTTESVDDSIKKIVGKIPSRNFLLTYYSTPVKTFYNNSSNQVVIMATESEIPYESLFRNYQFFTPGIFMGLIVSILLLCVFVVAFNAVNSLQISTAAFEQKSQTSRKKQ